MPLKITHPVNQVAVLNRWADDIEAQIDALSSKKVFAASRQAASAAVAAAPSGGGNVTLTTTAISPFDTAVGATNTSASASVTGTATNSSEIAVVGTVNINRATGGTPDQTRWVSADGGGANVFWTKVNNTPITATQAITSAKWAQLLAFFNYPPSSPTLPQGSTTAWTKITSGSQAAGSVSTAAVAVTPGHSILAVIFFGCATATGFTVPQVFSASDGAGNSWSQVASSISSLSGGTGAQIIMLLAPNSRGGAAFNITLTQVSGSVAPVGMDYFIYDVPNIAGYSRVTISSGNTSVNCLGL